MTKSERWILSEWHVANDRVLQFSENLISHRLKTPFAEVDLLFEDQKQKNLTLIEVKTWSGDLWAEHLISRAQRQRLCRARLHLESVRERQVRLMIAVVSYANGFNHPQLRYFDLDAY